MEFSDKDRVAAERQRNESQKMLEDISNGISESILLLTKDRKILWANDAAKKQAGQNITGEFCYKATHHIESPCNEHGRHCRCPLSDLEVYEAPRFVEHVHFDKKGNKIFVEVGAYPIKNETGEVYRFVHISRDVTERKQAEEALKRYREHLEEQVKERTAKFAESEERFRLAMLGANDGLWDWNLKTDECYYSPRWKSMLGYAGDEIEPRGRAGISLLHPEDRDSAMAFHKAFLEGRDDKYEIEFRMRHKDGHYINILSRAFLITDDRGSPLRLIGTHVDITDRKKAEERIRASLAEKEVLLKELHHRTKNNMQVISSLLNLQAMSIEDSWLQEAFEETRNRIKAMSLVHELLYKSKDISNLDVKEYIEDFSRALMKGYLEDPAKVSLKLDVQSIPLSIEMAIPCGLVINELLTNSLKYAFPGDRRGEIRIALHETGAGEMSLVYSDNGVGFPDGLDVSKTKTLGLRLVNDLASERLKGKLQVRQDKGTEFQITFGRKLS
jgi:PAS domain S-box-containing protein